VVHHAGVSRPTLYQHFGDLTSLIVAAVTTRLQTLFDTTLPQDDSSEPVLPIGARDGAGIEALLQRLLEEADVFRNALHGPSGYPVIRELSGLLATRLQQHGPVRLILQQGRTPDHLARFIGHGAVGIVTDWLDVPVESREPVSVVTNRLTQLLRFHLEATCAGDRPGTTDRTQHEEA
jgi:AcrR family transcriptional regulator